MNNRFKEVRRDKNLTQKEIADILGVSRDAIANIENMRSNPSELFINHFCNEFNVNKNWLLEGKGEMFLPELSDDLNNLAEIFSDLTLGKKPKLKKIMNKLPELDDEYLEVIDKLIDGLIKNK